MSVGILLNHGAVETEITFNNVTLSSPQWNNTATSQTKVLASYDLKNMNTFTFRINGSMSSARISGDTCTFYFDLVYADNTTTRVMTTTSNWSSATFTVDVSGKTKAQKANTRIRVGCVYSYSVATNRYTYCALTSITGARAYK